MLRQLHKFAARIFSMSAIGTNCTSRNNKKVCPWKLKNLLSMLYFHIDQTNRKLIIFFYKRFIVWCTSKKVKKGAKEELILAFFLKNYRKNISAPTLLGFLFNAAS